MTDKILLIILCLMIFNGLIRLAILGNISKICTILEEQRKEK